MSKANFSQVLPKILTWLVYLVIFVFPLVYWPKATVAFELPKTWLFNWGVELLAFGFGIWLLSFKPKTKTNTTISILVLLFLATVFVSSFQGINFLKSFWGNYYRNDGIFTLLHLSAWAIILPYLLNPKTLKKIPMLIGIGSLTLSIAYLVQTILLAKGFPLPSWFGVAQLPFGNPVFASGYLGVTLPFVFFENHLSKIKNRLYQSAAFLIQALAIISLQSMGGILLLGLFVFFKMLTFVKHKILKLVVLFVTGLATLIFAGFAFNQYLLYKQSRLGFVPEGRERIITKAVLGFEQRPYFGWGWANFDYLFSSIVWPYPFLNDVNVDKAHFLFLELLSTTGIVGTTFYLILIGFTIKQLRDKKLNVFLQFVFLYLVHSQTNIISVSEEILLWTSIGIAGITFDLKSKG